MIWYLNSKLDINLSCSKDFRNLDSMVTWCINWKRLMALIIFQRSIIKIISHYKKIGYNINVFQQTACLVVNPITVGNFAFLFNCTTVGHTSIAVRLLLCHQFHATHDFSHSCFHSRQNQMTRTTSFTHKAPPIICSRRQFQFFSAFSKITNKAWYFMRIVCFQTILMKYHTLFLSKIRKEVTIFVVYCSRIWRLKGYPLYYIKSVYFVQTMYLWFCWISRLTLSTLSIELHGENIISDHFLWPATIVELIRDTIWFVF